MNTSDSTSHSVARSMTNKRKLPLGRRLVTSLLVLAVLVLGAVAALNLLAGDNPKGNRYQAVFLQNGQVFFGKLKNTRGKYLTLEKAFYTQKPDVPASATAAQKTATDNNVSLVKVGDEVYGPENTMRIKAEQVLFWQDLKADSKVAKAIDSDK